MFKTNNRVFRFRACWQIGLLLWLASASCLRAFTARDAATAASAFNSAFYVQSGTNGWFKNTQSGGVTYFWGQAEMIECVIDAYEWSSNSAGQAQITNLLNGFLYDNGTSWTSYTPYNDDVMWAVLAFARGGVDSGRTNYCNLAKQNFDACYARAYDTNLGGGLYWEYPYNSSKNACVNGPGAMAAYFLYKIYGDTNYWNKATNLYAWERATLFNTTSGGIADNIGTNGTVNGGATTYNQGTFLGAAHFLGFTNDARLTANFTMVNMTSGGILPEYGIANNNSGFNAIFWRWMVRFMRDRGLKSLYEPWLQTNAAAAWSVRRVADSLAWCQWLHASPAGTNFYAWDCISAYEILQAADATQGAMTQAVPANPSGDYALDDASGTTAADSTGSGNNGMLSNAVWSTSGRFKGCLTFNGANSLVQITNLLCNDFSIAFWLKTTQSMGSGQWYYGAGLVDGDYPGVANDFGTALVGGKFAFGVGNPDVTIASAVSVNDGVWHQCVATRQQASGTMNVYVDGVLQGTGTANHNTLNGSAKLLFGAIASGGGYFNGNLDDVRLFTRALSSSEVAGLYSNNLAPPTFAPTNLVALAGNAQIQLNWAEAALATSYNVKRSLLAGGAYSTLTNVSTTAFSDAAVANKHTYYYVVSAVNATGEGAHSAEASASPLALAAWFKADMLTNLSSGASVSVWPDASGQGFNAFAAATASQPTYVSGVLNGLPVVRFNSSGSNYLWFYRPVQDDFTLILVFQSSQTPGTGTAFYNGAGLVNGEVAGTANDFGVSFNYNGQILAGTGNPDTSINSGTGYNNGVPHVVTFKRTKSSGGLVLYLDGNQVASGTGGTQSLTSPNTLVLGAQQTLGGFFTGDIAEVQIYNSPLADTDRLGLERTLRCKYGLSGGQIPVAPTGLTLVASNRVIYLNWTMTTSATTYNVSRSTNSGAAYQMVASGLTGSSFVDTNAANGLVNYYEVSGADACGAGTSFAFNGILLPLPAVSLNAGASGVVLNWPAWASDWKLYSTTNLTPPLDWTLVTNTAASSNSLFYVNLPNDASARYYRLVSP